MVTLVKEADPGRPIQPQASAVARGHCRLMLFAKEFHRAARHLPFNFGA
jgi:hypothetical protein